MTTLSYRKLSYFRLAENHQPIYPHRYTATIPKKLTYKLLFYVLSLIVYIPEVYIKIHSTSCADWFGVDSVVFGLPRVGNQQFADMVDAIVSADDIQLRASLDHWLLITNFATAQLPGFTHVSNQDDPVPTVPPHDLSFQHPSGEVHITAISSDGSDATMEACPGQENQVRSPSLIDSLF